MSSEDVAGYAERFLDMLSRAFDEVAVYVVRSRSVMVKAARGGISAVQDWDDVDVSVYLVKDRRIYTSTFPLRAAEMLLSRAEDLIARLEPSKLYAPLPEPSGESCSARDPSVEKILDESDYGALASAMGAGSGIDVSGMASVYLEEAALATSKGARLTRSVTGFEGYIRVFKGRDVSGQWSWVSTRLDTSLAKEALDIAIRLAEECSSLPREEPEEGVSRILLSPMTSSQLMEYVASAALAGSVITGTSFLSSAKPGDRVASEGLTLKSTPRDKGLPGYSLFDDEGVATTDVAFIESGMLKTLLHNTKTARILGGKSTGNAGWIFPRLFNLRVEPGDVRAGEELEALGNGVYITNNWYTRFQNYLEGTFSTVPRDAAFIVRSGRPVACVPGYKIRLEGSLRSMVRGVEALGSKLFNIKWWEVDTPTRAPHIVVSEKGGLRVRRA